MTKSAYDMYHWHTPTDIYLLFRDRLYHDPCPYRHRFDGLSYDYKWSKYNFVCPPLNAPKQVAEWVKRAYWFRHMGLVSVLLLPDFVSDSLWMFMQKNGGVRVKVLGRMRQEDNWSMSFVFVFPDVSSWSVVEVDRCSLYSYLEVLWEHIWE